MKLGDDVKAGTVIGTVEETPLLTHSILVPPDSKGGKVIDISSEGDFDLEQVISTIENNGNKVSIENVP